MKDHQKSEGHKYDVQLGLNATTFGNVAQMLNPEINQNALMKAFSCLYFCVQTENPPHS